MKQMLKLAFTLAIFASAACVCLALVNNVTAPTIAEIAEAELQSGLRQVFSDADSFQEVSEYNAPNGPVKINAVYYAKTGSEVSGVIIKATGPTYDKATMLIGISFEGKITGVRFLSLTDTPGFGQRANEPEWYNQFQGVNATSDISFKSKADAVSSASTSADGQIDGLSGASITSNGVMNIVRVAIETAAGVPVAISN